MNALRELIKLSKSKPRNEAQKKLFFLSNREGVNRKEIEKQFSKEDNLGHFSVAYSRFKYHLLDGIVNVSFSKIPKSYINRVKVWQRHLQIKILFLTGNRVSAVKLATQHIISAEKNHELEIVESMCKELMLHFLNTEPNKKRYKKYRQKYESIIDLNHSQKVIELAYQDLVNAIKTRLPLDFMEKTIIELDNLAEKNNYHRFRSFYYLTKSLYYRTINEDKKFIENNKEANHFFDNLDFEAPALIKYTFISELIPYQILASNFASASGLVGKCLELVPKNTFNWHRALIYKAYLGFYSNKPKIAYNSFKLAQLELKLFKSNPISIRWHIIKGYLEFFVKVNRVETINNNSINSNRFKLGKYLNIEQPRDDHKQKANLLIIELLHLLQDKKHLQYLEKLDRIEHYISTRFKAHKFKRTRYFLRMLKAVVKGNYHPVLTKVHAQKNIKKLEAAKADLDVNVLDIEYVPYEILWEEVMNILGGNRGQ